MKKNSKLKLLEKGMQQNKQRWQIDVLPKDTEGNQGKRKQLEEKKQLKLIKIKDTIKVNLNTRYKTQLAAKLNQEADKKPNKNIQE